MILCLYLFINRLIVHLTYFVWSALGLLLVWFPNGVGWWIHESGLTLSDTGVIFMVLHQHVTWLLGKVSERQTETWSDIYKCVFFFYMYLRVFQKMKGRMVSLKMKWGPFLFYVNLLRSSLHWSRYFGQHFNWPVCTIWRFTRVPICDETVTVDCVP